MTPRDPKGTEWVIKLKPGVTFHDGRPLTSYDVIYTFRRIIAGQYSAAHVLGPVDTAGIKALDPRTVLVPMARPYATLPEQLAGILTAQIVPAGFTARSRPNGTGPFQYKSFTAGQQSVFTRNPYYRQHGLPYAGTLTIIDFPDTTSLADALRTEQVHAARRYLSCLPPAASMPSCPRRGPSPPSRRPQPSNSLSSSSVRLWSAYED